MGKRILVSLFLLGARLLFPQDLELPPDLRQHNLLMVAPSLFNPVLSTEQERSHSLGIWTRWQWQDIDADPTTLLLNYTGTVRNVGFGAGFFQNNTEIFQESGGLVNAAYRYEITDRIALTAGANFFFFKRKLADNRLILEEPILPFQDDTEDFILRLAPALQFSYDAFAVGVVVENMVHYNVDNREPVSASGDPILLVMARYGFLLGPDDLGQPKTLNPLFYVKSIPGYDTQVGLGGRFTTSRYWVQGAYNSYYGLSLGLGGRFLQRFALGGIVEFGSTPGPSGSGTSYEFVASYSFGQPPRRAPEAEPLPEEEPIQEDAITEAARDSLDTVAQARELAMERQRDSMEAARQLALERRRDSVAAGRELAMQRERDSLQAASEARAAAIARERDSLAAARARELALERERDSIQAATEARALVLQQRRDSLAAVERAEQLALQRRRDSLDALEAARERALQRQRDSLLAARREAEAAAAQRRVDSLSRVRAALAEARKRDSLQELAQAQRRRDSLEAAQREAEALAQHEEVAPEAGERYQEAAASEDGLQPGFYLIANVFGTQRYYEAFMKELTGRGLEPKSFYRSENKYNYVYLQRYATIAEARAARDSDFSGKYAGDLWIMRIR